MSDILKGLTIVAILAGGGVFISTSVATSTVNEVEKTLQMEIKELRIEVSEIKGDIKVLLERTK